MTRKNVMIEVLPQPSPTRRARRLTPEEAAIEAGERMAAAGITVTSGATPVVGAPGILHARRAGRRELLVPPTLPPSTAHVFAATLDDEQVRELEERADVRVWPNPVLDMFTSPAPLVPSGGPDCTFSLAVEAPIICDRLGATAVHAQGLTGAGVVVGVLDSGIDGTTYPVAGGIGVGSALAGQGAITGHGSMCAGDIRMVAPDVTLHDYPLTSPLAGQPDSAAFIGVLQTVLTYRRRLGVPHVLNASLGFKDRPEQHEEPHHPAWDRDHPMNRKVRELVAAGIVVVFAAGNCGAECAVIGCTPRATGPGNSIHSSNSLQDVITVGAVNADGVRIGYSAQGPGTLTPEKPDVMGYSQFHGHFGPGRPGGPGVDDGTSAAAPVVAGVVALLLQARPDLTPAEVRRVLTGGAVKGGAPGWDADYGYGVVNAQRSLTLAMS